MNSATPTQQRSIRPIPRQWLYPSLLLFINLAWLAAMLQTQSWTLFKAFWPISVTMAFGSFVGSATAGGSAALAFPVFTKVLNMPTGDARTFSLMIQAVGMTMAAVLIYVRRVPVLPPVIWWTSLGGLVGQFIGAYLAIVPAPYPKLLFSFVAATFGLALALSRWVLNWPPLGTLPGWNHKYRLLFVGVGVLGGALAANIGSGINMLAFIVLTLAFGIHEKISTPTTVIIMAFNAIVGFFIHGVMLQDIGIAWNYWLVAVPIVVLGAPLGAYVCSLVGRDIIIGLLLALITAELLTTLWLVPLDRTAVLVMMTAVALCLVWFGAMLRFRRQWRNKLPDSVSTDPS